jgi:hypothetical protein
MTQAAKRPSTATLRTGGSQPALNGHDPRGEHDLRGEQDLVGDRDRDDGNDRDDRTERDERDSRDEQSDQRRRTERGEQWHGDRDELGDGREPRREPGGVQRSLEQVTDRARAATSAGGDALAPTPDMSKALTAWFDMVGDMMKLQQQFFADILGAGTTNDRNTTRV